MNIATSEPSLFQLTQNLDDPLVSQAIGAETLKSYISSIVELLIERQLQVTVWVKLPQTKSWLNQLQKLQQDGNAERIFLCSSYRNSAVLPLFQNDSKTSVVPLVFKKNSTLQRESFLIVLSADFCSLALAQWQKSKIQIDSSGKRLQQPYLEMVSSFSPQTIYSVLSGIQKNIILNTNFLQDEDLRIKTDIEVKSALLGDLIFKQIKHHEIIQNKLNSPAKTNQIPEPNTTVLGLHEDFLNNLVQELRSPITHMKTALSLLESKQIKGEQRQRYLELVSNECDRQNSLVNGLLGLLQLDTPIEAEHLRLNDVVPGIVSTYQPLAEEKDIQLGYTISANLPSITCPLAWFRQILINLLNNSLQFTPPQGRVSVQAVPKNDGEYVEISVIDTGVGIANQEINKIFDGFYRTKPSTNKKGTGAGLGLTLVQQLIQRCGGSISASSKVGKGTTFKILMPAVPAELTQ
ncbi:signal transduction histidine kinase [Pleurocapsales cyanobacterium LEGE 10410]|nr:signal transduction histidine kinase [Pleurocapsales cyanobacterium LEGE 10410]